jgi:hypothetical protein
VRPWGEELLKSGTITADYAELHRTQMASTMWLLTVINYTDSNGFSDCGTITADSDELDITQMASQNVALLLLTVENYTGLKQLLRMWHNYCRLWRITQDSKGFSECGTITADCGELHRTQTASQNVAQLLLTVENYTGLKRLLRMWHNYC